MIKITGRHQNKFFTVNMLLRVTDFSVRKCYELYDELQCGKSILIPMKTGVSVFTNFFIYDRNICFDDVFQWVDESNEEIKLVLQKFLLRSDLTHDMKCLAMKLYNRLGV